LTSASPSIPCLVIGGVSSGVGKTTVTIALARALAARGLRVALFKCGPDYLDPTYHARAVGAPSENLDGWMMGSDAVRTTFHAATAGADIALVEGVMGLFDGASPTGEEGSTAEIAKWLDAPVVLVVDAGGMARSAAAVVRGFASFDPALRLGGVILNRLGSQGHLELLRKSLRGEARVLGGLPRDAEHSFPERHLGLLTADEGSLPDALLDHWGKTAAAWTDLDGVLDAAAAGNRSATARTGDASSVRPRAAKRLLRLGVAYDAAFHFYYLENLRRLEAQGAELVRFSPLADAELPDVDGLYFGGGYPEVHGEALAANAAMRGAIRAFAERGGPVYAECGGLMYLTRAIRAHDGPRHDMVGLLPAEAVMHRKLRALGYVEVETTGQTLFGPPGTRFRGHQFRYSELVFDPSADVEHRYSVRRRRGDEAFSEGYLVHGVLASYVHAHFGSNPRLPAELVARCAEYAAERRDVHRGDGEERCP
jgi:cobyrinic acid a,c-diamide synthase